MTTPPEGGFQCARRIILVLIEELSYSYQHLARKERVRNRKEQEFRFAFYQNKNNFCSPLFMNKIN